jgi:hypothetical protein
MTTPEGMSLALSRAAAHGGLGNFRACLVGSVPDIVAF